MGYCYTCVGRVNAYLEWEEEVVYDIFKTYTIELNVGQLRY